MLKEIVGQLNVPVIFAVNHDLVLPWVYPSLVFGQNDTSYSQEGRGVDP